MDKKFLIGTLLIAIILCSTNSAYATKHSTSIFSDAQKYSDSNTYKNDNYGFSIQPPPNWVILSNLPAYVSNQTIVTFSNNDKSQYATFGISHRHIEQNVIDAINNYSDKDILTSISQEMSIPNSDSKITVYNGIVDRYNDGTRVVVGWRTQYTADNSTSLNESVFYFLNNGNQYTIDLTSNPDYIDKNSQLFEDSVNTFLVSQTSPVPEFPTSLIILIAGMFSIILISRIRNQ